MRPPMIRKLLPLVFVLAVVAAACSEATNAEVELGSGQRFVPLVADPLNDAGRWPGVALTSDGLPLVSYFGFEEATEEGAPPATRPVGAPSLPAVLLSTVDDTGIWTRGAIAMQAEIPTLTPAFAPAIDDGIKKLAADDVTGLQMVVDGDAFHAAWGSSDGLWYATGSTDPATATQVSLTKVGDTPPSGLSIAVDGSGTPWIAYYSSVGSQASVQLATGSGDSWTDDSIADASIPNCDNCTTAVVPTDGGVAVAYVDGGQVMVSSNDGENGYTSFPVEGSSGGEGLSGAATQDGIALMYYDGDTVVEAAGPATGQFQTTPVADVADGSADAVGARTSIAAAGSATYAAWLDSSIGVRFAQAGEAGFNLIETAPDTTGGQMPSVAVSEDGSASALAWYDPEAQDLLVGVYGTLSGLELAVRSPTPTGAPEVPPPPVGTECEPVVQGSVSVQATGIAFDTPCLDVPDGEGFQIDFGNQDAGTQHNIAIFQSEDDLTNPIFTGDIITGPDSITYDVPALDKGSYYFHCDVHPNMSGTINAGADTAGASGATGTNGVTGGGTGPATSGPTGASGATGASSGGGGGTTTVTAQNISFDTSEITLPAGSKSTLTFDNQDAGTQHNIAVYQSADDLTEALFRGDLLTGPAQTDYEIPPLDKGEYYFQCDVHPTMNGTVTVS
jgi:plastocyanin